MHNASFWRRYFQSMFTPHLERTLQVLEQRLLPTFEGIEAEATALQDKTYDELTSMPLDPNVVDEPCWPNLRLRRATRIIPGWKPSDSRSSTLAYGARVHA
jgi:hypothetical protein